MNLFSNIFKGICIGSGAILPGISSGVFCVIFGIYEKLLNSVLDFFKSPKENFKFLFPLILGAIIGVLIFSNFINYFLYAFPIQTKSLFIGLICASIPSLIKDVNNKQKFKPHYIIYTLLAFGIGLFSVVLEKNYNIVNSNNISIFYLIISGFLMSVGVVVPGVSNTIILMLLGVYPIYLSSVSSVYLPILIPLGIGLVFGGLVFMKATRFLLNRFYAQTFYSIIGFTLGSILVLIPEMTFGIDNVISILCIILGFFIFNILNTRI